MDAILEIKSYKDLLIWQRSIELCKLVYEITTGFPEVEKFGLVSQMKRSAVSIPSNIAEGYGRNYTNKLSSISFFRTRFINGARNPNYFVL